MKKAAIILFIITISILLTGSVSVRCLHPQTPIFDEPDFSSTIIFYIPQNAEIKVIEKDLVIDNTQWTKIRYGSYIGYVDSSGLYEENNRLSYTISQIKATSKTMGEDIRLYSANSTQSQVVASVKDGAKLNLVNSNIDYGDFYEINYDNQRVFIEKEYATTGLTYNQKTALIVGAVTLVTILLLILIINYIQKIKNPKDS
ncbi:MAG: SH3 domain-containing protein [Bacillota bacterium]